jgi:tetratricopeptide (TPR) repeat protein
MADDGEDIATGQSSRDAAAEAIAMAGASRGKADAYLDEQIELARLQKQNLLELNAFELSHLRWRRFNDQMKGAMQIIFFAAGILFVIAIAAAFWSAAHDDGMVIEAFHVAPDMEQRGLDGDVVSRLMLDRLTFLQSAVSSLRAPTSYSGASAGDIKVLIPDTGISLGEAYRYLAGWLGHQTHISGEVYRTATGIVLVARVNGNPSASFEGSDGQLNALMAKAAESVFAHTQPYRYAVYLAGHGRQPEADSVLRDLALNGPPSEKPWAYALWMYFAPDIPTSIARAQMAVALAPDNMLAEINASQAEAFAQHEEQVLAYARATMALSTAAHRNDVRADAVPALAATANASIAEDLGDWPGAIAIYQQMLQAPDFNNSHASSFYMIAAAAAHMHDVAASRRYMENRTDLDMFHVPTTGQGWNATHFDFPQFQQFVSLGDWAAARKDLLRLASSPDAAKPENQALIRSAMPLLMALVDAKTGDTTDAWVLAGKTPSDCYACLRVRGQIAQMKEDWGGASRWFARAVAFAPSIPFAYSEWGAMLMSKGDFDGAIAKFSEAHEKGPHFADPLEMWGEALIAKNRSDLALAKFEEANKYAPNWGRLHLKWGEALWWSGDRDGAAKQFAIAAVLDLMPAEKAELSRMASQKS